MNDFLDRVEAGLRRRCLLPARGGILVAVSGGVDSMVLLHGLHQLAVKYLWKLAVAHFNHQLRGRASNADEKLVCATAKKLSRPVFCERGDVKKISRQHKISIEMAARQLRHDFLARIARQEKISTVALAHHADDQVELFFLRLLRGTGGEGLAGMKWRSPSPADAKIALVRPLLDFTKAELLDFARENKIQFRDDATNFSPDFLRNRIRHELLPLLRKNYQPGLDKTVLRLMEIVGVEAEVVSGVAAGFCGRRGHESQTKIGNQSEPLHVGSYKYEELPLAVQRKVLHQQLAELGVSPEFELIERLREKPGQFVSVGPDLAVKRDAAGEVSRREQPLAGFNVAELTVKLTGRAGRVNFGGHEFKWKRQGFNGSDKSSLQLTEFFDADKIGRQITLRHWRPGDRFQPIGLKSAAKLQDLFVNAKIPAARRRRLVLAVAASGEIFWVEGLRIGEYFKLTAQTKRLLAWKHPKIEV